MSLDAYGSSTADRTFVDASKAKDRFTPFSGLPRVGLRASREVPGASLKAATGQGRRLFLLQSSCVCL